MKVYLSCVVRYNYFFRISKYLALARPILSLGGRRVMTKDDILRWHDDRPSISRGKNIVGGHHEHPRLRLCFYGKRDVHSHLVPVKVGVVRGTNKRVQLDCLAINQHRFKGLYTKPVQRRGSVKENRVFLDCLLQYIPNFRPFLFHKFFGIFDGGCKTLPYQPVVDKWLEELKRHMLGKPALVESQLRANHNNR